MSAKKSARPTVLVVYRQTPSQSLRVPAAAAKQHLRALDKIYRLLQERQLAYQAIPIDQLGPVRRRDLVITVGGDGTVLATSHFVGAQPILGVKSFGELSVGFFCAATTDTAAAVLDQILARQRKPRQLNRLAVKIDGHRIQEYMLNDGLFAHASPAAISDYRMTIGGVTETQRSSGVWISTASGATAAIRGAGGRRMTLGSKQMQYRVREPYTWQKPYALRGGVLPANAVIHIESLTDHGTFSIDGAHIQYPVPEGSRITIRRAPQPLLIYWE